MASTFNRSPVDVIKRKSLLRNKQPSEGLLKPGTRRILMSLSQMSPEAQRAMTTTREDAKENISNNENIHPGIKSFHDHGQSSDVSNVSAERDGTDRASKSSSRLLVRPPGAHLRGNPRTRRIKTSSFGTSIQTGTSRSRSTLSVTERNNSISDNMDSCDNQNNTDKINATSLRNSLHNKDNDSGNDPAKFQNIEALVHNSTTESNNNNISEKNNNNTQLDTGDHARRPESFVLALDRALEDNCISRLSGDITNTAGISELGKVRALDGGRLTNAQEVVVNVCYDDDRELVFHDNNEENMNNAKVTSNIRINLWIEYNKGFQPEDIPDDVEVITTNDNADKKCQTSDAAPCNDRTSSLPERKDKNDNTSSKRRQAASKHTSKSKLPATKTDLNNNKTTSKSKTHNFKTARSNSSSRNGSTNILDGVKRRDISSFKTEIKK